LQAKAEAQAQQLQREKLAGSKKEIGQTAAQENAAYKLLVRVCLGGGAWSEGGKNRRDYSRR
jgi:hypothetical protein